MVFYYKVGVKKPISCMNISTLRKRETHFFPYLLKLKEDLHKWNSFISDLHPIKYYYFRTFHHLAQFSVFPKIKQWNSFSLAIFIDTFLKSKPWPVSWMLYFVFQINLNKLWTLLNTLSKVLTKKIKICWKHSNSSKSSFGCSSEYKQIWQLRVLWPGLHHSGPTAGKSFP